MKDDYLASFAGKYICFAVAMYSASDGSPSSARRRSTFASSSIEWTTSSWPTFWNLRAVNLRLPLGDEDAILKERIILALQFASGVGVFHERQHRDLKCMVRVLHQRERRLRAVPSDQRRARPAVLLDDRLHPRGVVLVDRAPASPIGVREPVRSLPGSGRLCHVKHGMIAL
jgi:hypothetical protein